MDEFLKKAYSYAESLKKLYEEKLQSELYDINNKNLNAALEMMLAYEQKHYATIDKAKIPRYLEYIEHQNVDLSILNIVLLQNEFSAYFRVYTTLKYILNQQEFLKAIHNQEHLKSFVVAYLCNIKDNLNLIKIVKKYLDSNCSLITNVKYNLLYSFKEFAMYYTKTPKINFEHICKITDLEKEALEEIMSQGAISDYRSIYQILMEQDLKFFRNPEYQDSLKLIELCLRYIYQNASGDYRKMLGLGMSQAIFPNPYIEKLMRSTYKLCIQDSKR